MPLKGFLRTVKGLLRPFRGLIRPLRALEKTEKTSEKFLTDALKYPLGFPIGFPWKPGALGFQLDSQGLALRRALLALPWAQNIVQIIIWLFWLF